MVMTMHKVDDGIIEACRQGDRKALRLVFEAYKDKVYCVFERKAAPASALFVETSIRYDTVEPGGKL